MTKLELQSNAIVDEQGRVVAVLNATHPRYVSLAVLLANAPETNEALTLALEALESLGHADLVRALKNLTGRFDGYGPK